MEGNIQKHIEETDGKARKIERNRKSNAKKKAIKYYSHLFSDQTIWSFWEI